jgi:hypothetical protein
LALKIQSEVRIAGIQPIITSDEALDILPVDNPKFEEHGKGLLPLALDFQLDTLYIRYMELNLKPLLSGLKKFIFSRKDPREAWYEIFLTILVLLSTLEGVHEMQIRLVRKYVGIVSSPLG